MKLRPASALLLCAAIFCCDTAGADTSTLTLLNDDDRTSPIVGNWRMMPGGALFSIEPGTSPGHYLLRVLDSPDYDISPGAVMGSMHATATPMVFDAELYEAPGSASSRCRNCFIDIDAEAGHLTLRPYRTGRRVSFRRWLPYLFRVAFDYGNRPSGYDGAVRVGIADILPMAL